MEEIHFNKLWYIARLKFIEGKLNLLPDVRMGRRGNRRVLRYKDGGIHREIKQNSPRWQAMYSDCVQRSELVAEYNQLSNELIKLYKTDYEVIKGQYVVVQRPTMFTSSFWNDLIDNECPLEKTGEYYYDNHQFRSRFEMQAAKALRELRMTYKYDCKVFENEYSHFTDFAILLEEFDSSIYLETMGDLSSQYGINRNTLKFRGYCENGFIIGRDWTAIGATKDYMPSVDVIKLSIVALVNTLALMCVMKVGRARFYLLQRYS